jgi:dephospho-CoA kinase
MQYSESHTNAGLRVVSPKGVKLTDQGVDGAGRCAIAVLFGDEILSPNRSPKHSIILPLDIQQSPPRNRECFVSADKLTAVLMAGLPGAGKTTLSYALQKRLGWRVIDKDRYREDFLNKGFDDDHAGWNAYDYSFREMRDTLVEQHTSVILDSAALHPFILDEVMKIVCDVPNVLLKVILCVVDRDLRNERLRSREEQHTRHTVDPITIADYLQCFDHLPHDKLIIHTNVSIEECLNEVKKYVERQN